MLDLIGYRKFIEKRTQKLLWRWNCVYPTRFANVRWYRAVVSDGMGRRLLRRKCHSASDAQKYGKRFCEIFDLKKK